MNVRSPREHRFEDLTFLDGLDGEREGDRAVTNRACHRPDVGSEGLADLVDLSGQPRLNLADLGGGAGPSLLDLPSGLPKGRELRVPEDLADHPPRDEGREDAEPEHQGDEPDRGGDEGPPDGVDRPPFLDVVKGVREPQGHGLSYTSAILERKRNFAPP